MGRNIGFRGKIVSISHIVVQTDWIGDLGDVTRIHVFASMTARTATSTERLSRPAARELKLVQA